MTQRSALVTHCRSSNCHTMVLAVSEQAQLGLVCQCLELLGAPLGGWQSSNATSHQDANNSRDSLSGPLAQLLLQPGWLMQGVVSFNQSWLLSCIAHHMTDYLPCTSNVQYVNNLPNAKTHLNCPQTFLSCDFQCSNDVSELNLAFWDWKEQMNWLLSCITHHMTSLCQRTT